MKNDATSRYTGCTACGGSLVLVGLALISLTALVHGQGEWPPAPPLEAAGAGEDAAALPKSVSAQALPGGDEWQCTFLFRPDRDVKRVVLVGSFNGWDRHAHPMRGPDASGEWSVESTLNTGTYEYKFLVDQEEWYADPLNVDRVPDGFGGFNSVLRLGRLARLRQSDAKRGDGTVDAAGLSHRPPQPLYIQPLSEEEVSIRYRTLTNDVEHVWLAIKGEDLQPMASVCVSPLFTYWEARVPAPAAHPGRAPTVRSIQYTFVLDDGAGRVGDPHTYYYSFTSAGLFETPEWARHAVWYQVFLDRFRNGTPENDPPQVRPWTSAWFEPSPWEGQDGQTFYKYYVFDRFYGGDLAGLEAQLPYLKELGVSALYLNPIFKAPSNHKYDVQDFRHIDDGFGQRGDWEAAVAQEDLLDPQTWQWTASDRRFLAFLKRAHELGFKVVLDGVFNHVGDKHPAFVDVVEKGPRSRFADWFDVVSWEPLDYRGWAGFNHMPVFRKSRDGFASTTLRQHIFDITQRWMDPDGDGNPSDGIDGWRLDVPNDIPRPFWAQWRQHVKKINPDALITGEIWHRADQWLDGRHFDAVMNYEFAKVAVAWIFNREQKITATEAAGRLAELRLAYPAAATYALQNLVDSHDTDRLVSMAANPDRAYDRQNRVQDNNPAYNNDKPGPAAYARARLVALLQMTYVGAPLIYYGDEVGMWGADDPSNRKPMLWKDLQPYANAEEDCVLAEQLDYYQRLTAMRNAHAALRTGRFDSLLADDAADVWVFVRSDPNEYVAVALNASDVPRTVDVPLAATHPQIWTVMLNSAQEISAINGKLTIEVPAVGGVVLGARAK